MILPVDQTRSIVAQSHAPSEKLRSICRAFALKVARPTAMTPDFPSCKQHGFKQHRICGEMRATSYPDRF